ncbi:MAG: trypsin-like serine protease [Kofleriaceae bacterium]
MGLYRMRCPLLLLLLPACLESNLELGEITSAVDGGVTTTEMALDAAAILQGPTAGTATPICSGTFISDQWVLTARSCNVSTNGTYFIGSYINPDGFTTVHSIESVVNPNGTSATDWVDSSGNFADFTLVKIAGARGVARPRLAWNYCCNNFLGYMVGNGNHSLTPGANEAGQLRTAPTTTYQQHGSGAFLTTTSQTAGLGDQGGPFYVGPVEESSMVLGVLSNHYYFNGGMRDRFTSIPFHLATILQTIGWTWSGSTPQINARAIGNVGLTITQPPIGCQYAATYGLFVAYTHRASTNECRLLNTKTGTVMAIGWTTGSP